MLRNRAVALILCCSVSTLAFALGLGPLQSDSYLNEPFEGRMEILGAKSEDFDTLKVSLASQEHFERAGVDYKYILTKLKFAIDDSEPGAEFISITTRDSIREPYLNFLVELNWLEGRLIREYTVLLDPPLYDSQPRVVAQTPAPSAAPAAPVTPAADTASSSAAAAVAGGAYSAGTQVGPMQATDTLWSIASNYRPDESVTVQQMMLALLRANPEAFGESNVNLLRRGAVLRLPEREALTEVSAGEAFEEVRRQHQLWQDYRGEVAAMPAPQPVGAPAMPSAPAESPVSGTGDDARLELVAPGGEEDGGGAPGAASIGEGSELLREELDARSQQNSELQNKLSEAEEIIDLLQRQVNIKDEELAALQARLAELGVDSPALGALEPDSDLESETGMDTGGIEDGMTEPGEDISTSVDMSGGVDAGDMDEPEIEPETESEPKAPVVADVVQQSPDSDASPPPPPELGDTRGFPENLIPEHIARLVPGGALSIFGAVGALIVALLAWMFMRGRGDEDAAPAASTERAPAKVDAAFTSTIAAAEDDDSEAVTELGPGAADDDADTEAPTEFDPNATVEAEAEEDEATADFTDTQTIKPTAEDAFTATQQVAGSDAADAEEEEDPLQEVNIYLAYEQFDQAEGLVKRVIEQYPDRHAYKLSLLEVYYASNDLAAYEGAARELRDAVGEDDELWSSAVAMWSAMSPERELFAEGAAVPAESAPQDEGGSFVDITGEDDETSEPGDGTVAQAPGDDDGGLDFDLGDTRDLEPAAGDGGGEVLDLTAAADDDDVLDVTTAMAPGGEGPGDDDGVLDITAADEGDGVLDLTGGDGADDEVLDLTASDDGDAEMLDLTGGDEVFDLTGSDDGAGDGVLDITGDSAAAEGEAAAGADVMDLGSLDDTAIPSGTDDLLDVTKTGDVSRMDSDDLLNVTSPGADAAAELELPESGDDALSGDGEAALDFDISESVAPAFESTDSEEPILDITDGGADETETGDAAAAGGEDLLDFDIGGLDDELGGDDEALSMTLDSDQALDLDSEATTVLDTAAAMVGESPSEDDGVDAAAELSDGVDFDITMDSEDLAEGLEVSENEDEDGALEITMGSAEAGGDGALDLDIGVEDGETDLSLQGSELDDLALDSGGNEDFDIGLDGTVDMESIGTDDTVDMGSVDLGADDSEISLDIELDEPIPEIELDDDNDDNEQTVVMPVSDDVERQSDADEADTKLNLAKAYIELGDTDGARSILDEVVADGSDDQKAEAQSLLSQL